MSFYIIMKKGDGPLTLLYNKKQSKTKKRETFKLGINYYVFPTTVSGARHITLEANSHRPRL